MLYIATTSFSGNITMTKGKVGEIPAALVDDLLSAGYIVPYEATNKVKETVKETREETPKKRKGK